MGIFQWHEGINLFKLMWTLMYPVFFEQKANTELGLCGRLLFSEGDWQAATYIFARRGWSLFTRDYGDDRVAHLQPAA
jgi:hypothetical protein